MSEQSERVVEADVQIPEGVDQSLLPTYEEIIQDLSQQMTEQTLLISQLRVGVKKRDQRIQSLEQSGQKLMERIDELGGQIPSDVEAAAGDEEGDNVGDPPKRTRKKDSK